MLKSEFLRRGDRFFNIHYKAQKLNHKRSNTSTNIKIKKKLQWKIYSTAALVQYLLFLCGLASLKSSLLEEMSEICRPMAADRCFIIVGGWLELVSM